MIAEISAFVAATIAGIAFHEFGHHLAARNLGYNSRFGVNKRGFYVAHTTANKRDRMKIILTGVLLGYSPLILLMLYSVEIGVVWFIAWSFANYDELKVVYKLERELNK